MVESVLEWKMPALEDIYDMYRLSNISEEYGSDVSYVNMFLYRKKYGISISFYKDFYLRRYDNEQFLKGYGFPLGKGDYREILELLMKDAENNGRQLVFRMLSGQQKGILENLFPGQFEYTETRDDADYVYSRQDLADLAGRKYHKKKNHVSQFLRQFPDSMFEPVTDANTPDMEKVALQWYKENAGDADPDKEIELDLIREALACREKLKLSGGILYVSGIPAAMTLASSINETVADTHFEKAVDLYAAGGAYAAINQMFARTLNDYTLINREEDMGIEGLRRAKLSYQPQIILMKYRAEYKGKQ